MTIFGICEQGNYREENQDSILMRSKGSSGLFLVADGVGCSYDGAGASFYIARQYDWWWKNRFMKRCGTDFFSLFNEIKETAEQVNSELCQSCGSGKSCSTLALLFIHKGIFGYLSLGDSRIYRCSKEGVRQITRDDVWENCPDADSCPENRGKIISAVGGYERLEYSCATDKVCHRDVFLLCSDGIYRFIEENTLLICLQRMYKSLFLSENAVKLLAERAVNNGTDDNYSLIAVKV